jgi:hypothetical protein
MHANALLPVPGFALVFNPTTAEITSSMTFPLYYTGECQWCQLFTASVPQKLFAWFYFECTIVNYANLGEFLRQQYVVPLVRLYRDGALALVSNHRAICSLLCSIFQASPQRLHSRGTALKPQSTTISLEISPSRLKSVFHHSQFRGLLLLMLLAVLAFPRTRRSKEALA